MTTVESLSNVIATLSTEVARLSTRNRELECDLDNEQANHALTRTENSPLTRNLTHLDRDILTNPILDITLTALFKSTNDHQNYLRDFIDASIQPPHYAISCIKALRTLTGLGLRDCKHLSDEWIARHPIGEPNPDSGV